MTGTMTGRIIGPITFSSWPSQPTNIAHVDVVGDDWADHAPCRLPFGRATFAVPVYALKVLRSGGMSPAAKFDAATMSSGRRWRTASTWRRTSVFSPPTRPDQPVLCIFGWHAYPFLGSSGGDRNAYSSWRALYHSWNSTVWLVRLRGDVVRDGSKIAAMDMRYVRPLAPTDIDRLRYYTRDADRLRRFLDVRGPVLRRIGEVS